ncbi:MAG: hypothetical protein QNJ64_15475 [Crocosphaera sp.]|nr:hypothetical protein [Crocosphaera sp.]
MTSLKPIVPYKNAKSTNRYINIGNFVYAGVDYEEIVKQAQQEADIILWDGRNNDFPFICSDLHLILVAPLRPGDETTHHPGEVVLRIAEIVD